MSKEEKVLTWGDIRFLRVSKNYSQEEFGALLGMTQSTLSTKETDDPSGIVDPLLARRALEAPIKAPRARGKTRVQGIVTADELSPPTSARSWVIQFARGLLPPGTKLVETGPLVPVGDPSSLNRTFVAIGGDKASPTQQTESPGAPVGVARTSEGASERSTNPGALESRFSIGFGFAASLVALTFVTGCVFSHRPPSEAEMAECDFPLVQSEVYTGNASGTEASGSASAHSIKMPKKPYAGQKLAPCDPQYEFEEIGACWWKMKGNPPCPYYAVEWGGECLVPVPERPKAKNSMAPTE